MTGRLAPADGRVVAKLAYPMPAGDVYHAVRALEAVYGTGLLVNYAHPDAREWMVITNPTVAPAVETRRAWDDFDQEEARVEGEQVRKGGNR